MGTLRLLMALVVMIFHLGVPVFGVSYGVSAVVVFFIISGFAITALVQSHYLRTSRLPAFFLDRLLRLYPQYLLYVFAVATVGTLLGLSDTYFHTECSPGGYALNLSLVPLDYWESFGTATFRRCMLISQSWTIGLEFQIYIVLGILLVTSSRRIAFSLSGTVFLFALFGAFAYKWFIYVYVPPALFIFLYGSMLATGKRGELAIVAFTWVASVAGLLFAHLYPERMAFLGFEMLLGIAIGIPAVAIASRLKVSAFDGILGSMSYGVYLNHYLLILAVRKLAPAVPGGAIEAALTVPLACFFAWLTYSVRGVPSNAMA